MVINLLKVIGILGLISIITGTFMISLKKNFRRKHIYPFLLLGGIFLMIYSIYIKDPIFIILQGVYILIVIYDIIKLKISKKR